MEWWAMKGGLPTLFFLFGRLFKSKLKKKKKLMHGIPRRLANSYQMEL